MTNLSARDGSPQRLRTAYIILTLTSLFWGGNVVAGKLAVGEIEPNALIILRWTGALLAILPFAIRPLARDWAVIRGKWWLYAFYGAVGFVTFNVLVYTAAHFTSGVNTAIEQVAVNIFVMLLNFVLFRTRVQALQLLGVVLTILGVALTATHGDLGRLLALQVNVGDLMVIFACFTYAIYSITLRWKPATHWMSFFRRLGSGCDCRGVLLPAGARWRHCGLFLPAAGNHPEGLGHRRLYDALPFGNLADFLCPGH